MWEYFLDMKKPNLLFNADRVAATIQVTCPANRPILWGLILKKVEHNNLIRIQLQLTHRLQQ